MVPPPMLRFLILLGLFYVGQAVVPTTSQFSYQQKDDDLFLTKIELFHNETLPSIKLIDGPWKFRQTDMNDVDAINFIFSSNCNLTVPFQNVYELTISRKENFVNISDNMGKKYTSNCAALVNFRIEFQLIGKANKYLVLDTPSSGQVNKVDMTDDIVPTQEIINLTEPQEVFTTASTTVPPVTVLVDTAGSPAIAIVVCIIVGLLCLAAGAAAGFFGRGFYDKKFKKHPPPPPAAAVSSEPSTLPADGAEPSTATADLKAQKIDVRKKEGKEKSKEKSVEPSKNEVRFSSEATHERKTKASHAETMSEKVSRKDKKANANKHVKVVSKKEKEADPLLKGSKE